MIYLERKYEWYRPYQYGKYTIEKINFYDKNGVVISSYSGWLENKGRDLEYLCLNIDEIPLKRKEDFSIKGAFIISKGKDFSDELKAELYINIDVVGLHFTEYRKEYDNIRKYYVGHDYNNNEFEVFQNKKFIKEQWYLYKEKIEVISKKLSYIFMGSITEEEYKKYISDLKKYGNKLFEEEKKCNEYSVEDYLKELGE